MTASTTGAATSNVRRVPRKLKLTGADKEEEVLRATCPLKMSFSQKKWILMLNDKPHTL